MCPRVLFPRERGSGVEEDTISLIKEESGRERPKGPPPVTEPETLSCERKGVTPLRVVPFRVSLARKPQGRELGSRRRMVDVTPETHGEGSKIKVPILVTRDPRFRL